MNIWKVKIWLSQEPKELSKWNNFFPWITTADTTVKLDVTLNPWKNIENFYKWLQRKTVDKQTQHFIGRLLCGLKNWFFDAIKLKRNTIKRKFIYKGYGIAFDGSGSWNFDLLAWNDFWFWSKLILINRQIIF